MRDLGSCPACGRPRTTTPTGAPVSCCPRVPLPPRRREEATSVLDAVTGFLDRGLVAAGGRERPSRWVGLLVAAAIAAMVLCAGIATRLL